MSKKAHVVAEKATMISGGTEQPDAAGAGPGIGCTGRGDLIEADLALGPYDFVNIGQLEL
jgi:hypothetical protein